VSTLVSSGLFAYFTWYCNCSCISKIGETIQAVADNEQFQVVHEFCGHGVGPILHLPPLVRHFQNRFKHEMKPGMVFTIEPIFGKF
jgi:methionyl aminopeptidase